MAFWPTKNEPDPRPELGAPYRRIRPVAPVPGTLWLPIAPVDAT